MTNTCCIVMCRARPHENKPGLTFHRFPRNEALRKKWLEAIGEENINRRPKILYICSLHFEQSCFNRTLEVIRLHDNSIPTIFPILPPAAQGTSVLRKTSNVYTVSNSATDDTVFFSSPVADEEHTEPPAAQGTSVLRKTSNVYTVSNSATDDTVFFSSPVADEEHTELPAAQGPSVLSNTSNVEAASTPATAAIFISSDEVEVVPYEKLKTVKEKYLKQQKKIKCLNERLRRKAKKIAVLKHMIEDLRNNKIIIINI